VQQSKFDGLNDDLAVVLDDVNNGTRPQTNLAPYGDGDGDASFIAFF
jgi:hypothetical protein